MKTGAGSLFERRFHAALVERGFTALPLTDADMGGKCLKVN